MDCFQGLFAVRFVLGFRGFRVQSLGFRNSGRRTCE